MILVVIYNAGMGPPLMKDAYTVLSQKEQDVARLRKEILALLTVIPLLADDTPSSAKFRAQSLSSSRPIPDSTDNGMAELERYYPFTRKIRS
jgi:hypothetical protein